MRCLLAAVTFGGLLLAARAHQLQASPATSVDPRAFGVNVPPGPVVQECGTRVLTVDEDDAETVAQVHVAVGDYRIVMLPDGQLAPRRASQTRPTDRPFEARSKDDIAKQLTGTTLRGFKTKQTRRYLYVYNTSEPFALATSRILETMYPGVFAYMKGQRIEVRSPQVALVVVMFRTEDEFQAYRAMPPGVAAYYDTLSNHVVLYEQKKLALVDPHLAVRQAISIIAHEGAHQILCNIGVQQRLSVWPTWLAEGLAEFFAPTSFGKNLTWKGAGQVNDMRMSELEEYLKAHSSQKADGRVIEQTVGAARLTSTGYASAWSLTHFLAHKRRSGFRGLLGEVSRIRPLEGNYAPTANGLIPENSEAFNRRFGEDLAALEERLVLHLRQLPYTDPFASWPHFVAMISRGLGAPAGREAKVFLSSQLAEQWRRERLETPPVGKLELARSEIRLFPNRALAEQFARRWLRGF